MSNSIRGQGNPQTFGCVHAAGDGKLGNHNVQTLFSNENKKEIICHFMDLVKERANQEILDIGMRGLCLILNDTGMPPNYQVSDRLYADDVLIEIILILNQCGDSEVVDTAVNLVCEQMSDMLLTSGTCPSGRVNRLYNVLVYLREYNSKSSGG